MMAHAMLAAPIPEHAMASRLLAESPRAAAFSQASRPWLPAAAEGPGRGAHALLPGRPPLEPPASQWRVGTAALGLCGTVAAAAGTRRRRRPAPCAATACRLVGLPPPEAFGAAQGQRAGSSTSSASRAARGPAQSEEEEQGRRSITCRMSDPEGEEGLYTGPGDASGKADGIGRFAYDADGDDEGDIFVGEFVKGSMVEGVLYRQGEPLDAMAEGSWEVPEIGEMVERYPLRTLFRIVRQQVRTEKPDEARMAKPEKAATARPPPSAADDEEDEGEAIGIDLGTTNSCVAVFNAEGRFVVVPAPGSKPGNPVMPSVVAYNDKGAVLVGHEALKIKGDGVRQVVFRSVKRLIGRSYAEAWEAGIDPQKCGADPKGRADDLIRLLMPGGKTISPEEVLADLIRGLVKVAEEYLKRPVGRAVFGVPARYNMQQQKSLQYAASLAGLPYAKLVKEPELAVRAYGYKVNPKLRPDDLQGMEQREKEALEVTPEQGMKDAKMPDCRNILVADLGGGTFDVCMVRQIPAWDEMQIIYSMGDGRLGGDDFDDNMVEWALKRVKVPLQSQMRGLWPLTAINLQKLRLVCRSAKEKLTYKDKVDFEFAGVKMSITRGEFNVIVGDTLQRMLMPIRQCAYGARITLPYEKIAVLTYETGRKIRNAKKVKPGRTDKQAMDVVQKYADASMYENDGQDASIGTIDEVLCIGAASWTPAVRELLELITGCSTTLSVVDPETAVAIGAAVQAATMDEKVPDLQVHSAWRTQMATFVSKRPDLMKKLKREQSVNARNKVELEEHLNFLKQKERADKQLQAGGEVGEPVVEEVR
mmetsp:Transcript_52112/g.167704  ORF Transcript_52112/g.167704 Transcript_52112/m.167704 type:complete len:818 (-) Transcript_52112:86-2539(-)